MYANESTDNKYPHLQIDYSVAYNENADGQTLYSKGGPDAFQLYPEYASDVSIGNCPGDANLPFTVDDITHPVDNTESKNGHNWCNDLKVCETDTIQFTRKRMTGSSFSYVYMPKLIRSDWIADPADNAMLAKLYSTINTVENRNDDITLPLFRVDSGPKAWNKEVTLHHLHEGIERFFITDINNPGHEKTIQSVIPIMWDPIADNAGVSYFNHLPGGSNVLYMDGHVEFIKYPAVHSQSTWPISSASIDNRLEDESW